MLRTLRPSALKVARPLCAIRSIHSRVELPYSIDNGVGSFLSKNALQTIAVDWQQGVLDRLNELVRGGKYADLSVLQTLKQTATDPAETLAFNYASEALNNSFFLSTLSTESTSRPSPNSPFTSALTRSSLESFPSLISHFSAHVSGLHPSSGAYVWLATDSSGNIGVLGTYAGGTLLMQQRMQRGELMFGGSGRDGKVLGERLTKEEVGVGAGEKEVETSVGEQPTEEKKENKASEWLTTQPESAKRAKVNKSTFGNNSVADLLPSSASLTSTLDRDIGKSILPLACISLHPHCYLADYGVWGREEYVRNWFEHVDWKKVEASYAKFVVDRK
ncbi:superoxide dismutase, Fe-Mn family, partial [Phenoliferia sp. Uapishka_3]